LGIPVLLISGQISRARSAQTVAVASLPRTYDAADMVLAVAYLMACLEGDTSLPKPARLEVFEDEGFDLAPAGQGLWTFSLAEGRRDQARLAWKKVVSAPDRAEPYGRRRVGSAEWSSRMVKPSSARIGFDGELIGLIPQLRAFACALSGGAHTGDDLAQETLARALAARSRFEAGTNMKAWTFTILRNLFYSDKRRSWRSCELDPGVAESTLVAADNPTSALELDELRRALTMLPVDQREALILVGAAGLSYEEVSVITGTPLGTVKSRVSRARNHLALIYAEGDIAQDNFPAHTAMSAIFMQVTGYQIQSCP